MFPDMSFLSTRLVRGQTCVHGCAIFKEIQSDFSMSDITDKEKQVGWKLQCLTNFLDHYHRYLSYNSNK